MPFLPFVYGYPSSSPRAHCTPNKSVPTLRYTHKHGPIYIYIYTNHACRHLPSAVPWISEDHLFDVTKLPPLSLSMNCANTVTKRLQCWQNCLTNFHLQMNCKQHVLWVQGLTLFIVLWSAHLWPPSTKETCLAAYAKLTNITSVSIPVSSVSCNSYWCSESCKNKIPWCHI